MHRWADSADNMPSLDDSTAVDDEADDIAAAAAVDMSEQHTCAFDVWRSSPASQ